MLAAFMYGAGDVRVETAPDPVIQHPTDAIVRTVRSCICGSDLHPYHSQKEGTQGRPVGHELIAVVEEVGANVRTLRPGDFVIATFAFQDNTCGYCREGLQTSCVHGGFYGRPDTGGLQASLARIPWADGSLVKVPDVDPDAADAGLLASLLTLSDVYLTGYHAAHVGAVGPGRTVAVIGDGAVGLSGVLAARELGAERVILMGRHPDRTALGVDFGATEVVSARGSEGVAEVRDLTGGEGAHVVIEAVGLLPAFEQAAGIVRAGGVISRDGLPQFSQMPFVQALFYQNIRIAGGPAPVRAYIDAALPRVLDGAIDPGRVFDRTLPLEDAPEGYAAMDARESLKVMLTP